MWDLQCKCGKGNVSLKSDEPTYTTCCYTHKAWLYKRASLWCCVQNEALLIMDCLLPCLYYQLLFTLLVSQLRETHCGATHVYLVVCLGSLWERRELLYKTYASVWMPHKDILQGLLSRPIKSKCGHVAHPSSYQLVHHYTVMTLIWVGF